LESIESELFDEVVTMGLMECDPSSDFRECGPREKVEEGKGAMGRGQWGVGGRIELFLGESREVALEGEVAEEEGTIAGGEFGKGRRDGFEVHEGTLPRENGDARGSSWRE
jgi:hypothetical protein